MFRHIVLYKLKDRSEASAKALYERFLTMEGKIPYIKEISVGCDTMHLDRSFDVSLSIIFDSKEDFLAYKEYPYHRDEIVPYVHSVIEQAVSVDSLT